MYKIETIAYSWIDGNKKQAYEQWKESDLDAWELSVNLIDYMPQIKCSLLMAYFLDQSENQTRA